MSACEAPGGSIMAIGLPGTTRTRTKTMSATPNSVTTVEARRMRTARRVIGYFPLPSRERRRLMRSDG